MRDGFTRMLRTQPGEHGPADATEIRSGAQAHARQVRALERGMVVAAALSRSGCLPPEGRVIHVLARLLSALGAGR